NIIWGVGTNAVLDSLSTVTVSYSDVSGTGIYPGTGNILADPLFLNPAARDYRLLPNSPCIDAGDPAAPHDPDGTRADMGAVSFDLSYLLPVIVIQPQNYTVAEGCDATFKVVAASPLPLNYQWRRNDADILGATNDTLVVQNVKLAQNSQQYSVVVSNAAGPVTSSDAVLTVSADISAPMISAQPQSQTVAEGTNVTFTVVALKQCTGSDGLTYQWFFNATNVIAGATNSALVLTNVQPSAAGAYSVRVRDAADNGTDSDPATLTVLVKPTITVQPASQTVAPGATVTFRLQAEGTPPLHYQWRAGWVPG